MKARSYFIRLEDPEIICLVLQHFDVKVLFENADKRKRECDRERKAGVHMAEPFIRRTSGSEQRVRQNTKFSFNFETFLGGILPLLKSLAPKYSK